MLAPPPTVKLDDVFPVETPVSTPYLVYAGTVANNITGDSRLSCIEQSNLECDNNVQERGNTLCRARANGGGLFDGGRIIQNLGEASVN